MICNLCRKIILERDPVVAGLPSVLDRVEIWKPAHFSCVPLGVPVQDYHPHLVDRAVGAQLHLVDLSVSVPLIELPLFDPSGLPVIVRMLYEVRGPLGGETRVARVRSTGDDGDVLIDITGAASMVDLPDTCFLDLTKARARDAGARWMAWALGLEVGSTAPLWRGREGHWVLGGASSIVFAPKPCHQPPASSRRRPRRVVIPELAHLPWNRPHLARERLPDGSFRLDAVALVLCMRRAAALMFDVVRHG